MEKKTTSNDADINAIEIFKSEIAIHKREVVGAVAKAKPIFRVPTGGSRPPMEARSLAKSSLG